MCNRFRHFVVSAVICAQPPLRQHSDVLVHDDLTFQTVLTHQCHIGYQHNNNISFNSTCTLDGSWSDHGTDCTGKFIILVGVYDSYCLHNCYNCETSNLSKCHVTEVECGPPPEIAHSLRTFSQNTYQSEVTYACVKGYWLEKYIYDVTIQCNHDGVWFPTVSDCTGKIYRHISRS